MHDPEEFPGKFLHFWYKIRGGMMIVPYVCAFFWMHCDGERPEVFIVGMALIVAAFLLRLWAQLHLHYRLKVKKILTMTGPYSYVRNPIYIANIMLLSGYVMMSELVWFVPVSIFYGYIVYHIVVAHEEYHLKEKYGAPYMEYLDRVPRWIPRLSDNAKGSTPEGKWSHVRTFLLPSLKAEYHCLCIALIPLTKKFLGQYTVLH